MSSNNSRGPSKGSSVLVDERAPVQRLIGIVVRVGMGKIELKIGTQEAQEATENPELKEKIIELNGCPDLPLDLDDVFEANVKLLPSKKGDLGMDRYNLHGFPLISIPLTEKAITKVFQKFLRSESKVRSAYNLLLELNENPENLVRMLSLKASRWFSNRNTLPGMTLQQTNSLLRFWYQERNLRQLLLYGLNKKEIFTYRKYAERSEYEMAGDILTNPSAIFNVSAFKLKSISKITGRIFWENVHSYLNRVFLEMFNGKLSIPVSDLTPAEQMLLEEMPVYVDRNSVSLNYAHSIHRDLRKFLRGLIRSQRTFGKFDQGPPIPERFNNDSDQKLAFSRALREPFLTIQGPAGTGKSELSLYIFDALVHLGRKVSVGAYTGKASANLAKGRQRNILSMAAQRQFDPRTLHSLIKSKATIETLLIDEVSMLNAELLTCMIREHPEISQLILVGDIAQLPPMGIGHLLASLDGRSYSVELRQTHRFDGDLLDVATAIRTGKMPIESENFRKLEGNAETATALVKSYLDLPECSINDLAVVTYYNKTVDEINFAIQKILLKRGQTEKGLRDQRKQRWNIGDRVIFLENNPDIGVWNGQEGRVQAVDPEEQRLIVNFDGVQIRLATTWSDKVSKENKEDENLEKFEYTAVEDLSTRQIRLSYALTGYKAQGSQWKTVIVFLENFGKSNKRINRNYLYTAVTRAQESLFFIGTDFHLKRGISEPADSFPFSLDLNSISEIKAKKVEVLEDNE